MFSLYITKLLVDSGTCQIFKAMPESIFSVRQMCLIAFFLIYSIGPLFAQELNHASTLQQARDHMQLYAYEQALPLLQQVVAQDSLDTDARWLLGQCYSQLGRIPMAKSELEGLLRYAPDHKPARAMLGQLFIKEINYPKAAQCFEQLLALDSTNAWFHRQRASIAQHEEDIETALYHYQKAIALQPLDLESTIALAELSLKVGDMPKAAMLLQEGLKQDSSNLRLWRLQIRLLYKEKAYEQLVEAMDYQLAAGDTALYDLQMLGISHFHLNNSEKAIYWLEFVVQEGVDTEILYYYLGLSYRNAGNNPKAIWYLEKAAQKGISENLSHYYTQMAVTFEEQGDHKNAIRTYQLAYKNSGEKKLLYHLARNYDKHYKDKRVALSYYEKYLTEIDTANAGYQDYARHRARHLKEYIHFSADTL